MFKTLLPTLSLIFLASTFTGTHALPTSSPSNSTHTLVTRGTCGSRTFSASDLVGNFYAEAMRVWLRRDTCNFGKSSLHLSLDPTPLTTNLEIMVSPSAANLQRRTVMLWLKTKNMKNKGTCVTLSDVYNLLNWYTEKECNGANMPMTLSDKVTAGVTEGSMVVGKNSPFHGLKWEFVVQ